MDEKNTREQPASNQYNSDFFPSIRHTSTDEKNAIKELIAQAPSAKAPASVTPSETIAIPVTAPEKKEAASAPEPPVEPKKTETVDANIKGKNRRAIPDFPGLIPETLKKYDDSPALKVILTILIGAGLFVALLVTIGAMASIYLACIGAILLCAITLFAICAALVAIGAGGLCYGIVQLFTRGFLIGFLEIGLALILSGFILALTALSDELTKGQLPKLMRFLTRWFIYLLRFLLAFVFGARHFRKKEVAEVAK